MKKRSALKTRPLMLFSQGSKKRGQVTIFIIVAILIVAVLLSFFLWIGPIYFSEGSREIKFEKCVEDVVEVSIAELAKNAGFVNPEFTYMYNSENFPYLCYTDQYHKTCVLQKVFLDSHFKEGLESSIENGVNSCYTNSIDELKDEGYSVVAGEVKYNVTFNPSTVNIQINAPTNIGERKFTRFNAKVNSPIYEMVMIATSLLQYESVAGDSDVSTLMLLYPNYIIDKIKRGDGTTVYIIEDKVSKIKFQFASRSLVFPAGY